MCCSSLHHSEFSRLHFLWCFIPTITGYFKIGMYHIMSVLESCVKPLDLSMPYLFFISVSLIVGTLQYSYRFYLSWSYSDSLKVFYIYFVIEQLRLSFYLDCRSILASINIGVFLFEIASPIRNSDFEKLSLPLVYGAKINQLILSGEWWRLVTPMFLVQDWDLVSICVSIIAFSISVILFDVITMCMCFWQDYTITFFFLKKVTIY